MVQTVLVYHKGATQGSITINTVTNDRKFTDYDPSWADTGNTQIKVFQESDLDTTVLTISGSDIETVGTNSIDFKKSSLSTLNRDNYIVKVIPGDGTDTDEGRFEMRVV
jgi:hypothetical protein